MALLVIVIHVIIVDRHCAVVLLIHVLAPGLFTTDRMYMSEIIDLITHCAKKYYSRAHTYVVDSSFVWLV